MTTNLLATVIVAVVTTTNDIPRWTPQTWRDGQAEWTMYIDEAEPATPFIDASTGEVAARVRSPSRSGPKPDDNERVRVVETKRVTRLTFEWNGKPREIIEEKQMSETRTVLVRSETWTPKAEGGGR